MLTRNGGDSSAIMVYENAGAFFLDLKLPERCTQIFRSPACVHSGIHSLFIVTFFYSKAIFHLAKPEIKRRDKTNISILVSLSRSEKKVLDFFFTPTDAQLYVSIYICIYIHCFISCREGLRNIARKKGS